MSQTSPSQAWARTEVSADGAVLLTVGGAWKSGSALPEVAFRADRVAVRAEGLEDFDSCLPA
ncbi:MAG: hypothetical protein ACKORI_02525, partial [Verrucomicrobiota bacterium]